jgi:hypothetical protein
MHSNIVQARIIKREIMAALEETFVPSTKMVASDDEDEFEGSQAL